MSDSAQTRPREAAGGFSRQRIATGILAILTLLAIAASARLVVPFVPALAWAFAIAVVAQPLERWIAERVRFPSLASAIAVAIVAVAFVAPAIFVTQTLVSEATTGFQSLREVAPQGWQTILDQNPRLAPMLQRLQQQASGQLAAAAGAMGPRLSGLVTGGAAAIADIGMTIFFLFFFFRDRDRILATLRSLLPLTAEESRRLSTRVVATVRATLYGSVAVAVVQGALGGLMFWLVGLPAPILWGSVMAILAIVPVLGTFVIWAPAAAFLLLSGEWVRALVIVGWGCTAIAFVDNLLYPVLVGKDLHLHTIPVFISLVGGIAIFGVSGLILGPVTLAVTIGLLDVWRRRTGMAQITPALSRS